MDRCKLSKKKYDECVKLWGEMQAAWAAESVLVIYRAVEIQDICGVPDNQLPALMQHATKMYEDSYYVQERALKGLSGKPCPSMDESIELSEE